MRGKTSRASAVARWGRGRRRRPASRSDLIGRRRLRHPLHDIFSSLFSQNEPVRQTVKRSELLCSPTAQLAVPIGRTRRTDFCFRRFTPLFLSSLPCNTFFLRALPSQPVWLRRFCVTNKKKEWREMANKGPAYGLTAEVRSKVSDPARGLYIFCITLWVAVGRRA